MTARISFILPVLFCLACSSEPVSTLSGEGTHIDNGGDLVTCKAGSESPHVGDYTLDYVLTFDPAVGDSDDLSGDWPSIRDQVTQIIEAKLPKMAPGWRDYLALLMSRDESRHRVWKGSVNPPSNIRDEDIINRTPDNCKTMKNGRLVPDLKQMVRRRYRVETDVPKLFYLYDHSTFEDLRRNRPLQYSYIIVHEWLWDYAPGAWANRSVNRIIHSVSTKTMSAGEVQRSVRSYGITGDEGGFLGRPSPRAAEMRQTFEAYDTCQYSRKTTAEFMQDQGRVHLARGQSVTLDLKVGDLSDAIGSKACGYALLLSSKGLGRSTSGSLRVELRRGAGSWSRNLGVSTQERQYLFTGVCEDGLCINRSGQLSDMLTYDRFSGSSWKLKLMNSTGGPVEVFLPYLTFVKMSQ